MHVKNYTSNVPVSRTIARIEQVLAQAGVTNISKNFHQGRVVALIFQVPAKTRSGFVWVKLPVDATAVYASLRASVKRPRRGTEDRLMDQADRTAWKLMEDLVRVQLSLIQLQKRDLVEIFLSYIYDGEQTFYERLKSNGFKQLTQYTETPAD